MPLPETKLVPVDLRPGRSSRPVPTPSAPNAACATGSITETARPILDDAFSTSRIDVREVIRSSLQGLIDAGNDDVSILARLSYLEQLDLDDPDFLVVLRECSALIDEPEAAEVNETRTITVGQPGAQCSFVIRVESAMGEPAEFTVIKVDPSFNGYAIETRTALNEELHRRLASMSDSHEEPPPPSKARETS